MREFIIYVGIAMTISLVLLGLAFYAFFRKREKNISVAGSNNFDVPIWQGKVKEVTTGEHRNEADLDVIVYSKSIFIGFASQCFPFVSINADEIVQVSYSRHSVSIRLKGNVDEPSSYVTVKGASEKDLLQFAKKAEYIGSRAKKQGNV